MDSTTLRAMTSTGKDDWATPDWLFQQLDAEFHFDLDPCCTHETAKCEKHFTPAENGLVQDWGGTRYFATRPTPAKLKPTPGRLPGYRNVPRRPRSPEPLWWPCCRRERTQSFSTVTYTAKLKSVFSKAGCRSSTTAKRRASLCSAQ